MKPVTNEDLHAARLEVERTQGPYEEAVKVRNALVKQALKQGIRLVHVARLAGVTRQRVHQLR